MNGDFGSWRLEIGEGSHLPEALGLGNFPLVTFHGSLLQRQFPLKPPQLGYTPTPTRALGYLQSLVQGLQPLRRLPAGPVALGLQQEEIRQPRGYPGHAGASHPLLELRTP